MTHLTVNGRVSVRRTVYWSSAAGTVIPVDQWLGLTEQRVSPGVRELCRREALHCPFEVAMRRICNGRRSCRSVGAVRRGGGNGRAGGVGGPAKGTLRPAFTAADCTAKR